MWLGMQKVPRISPYRNNSEGGSNEAENLITCCHRCNSVRGDRPWELFATDVAGYLNHGIPPAAIISHIYTTKEKPLGLYVKEAKALIARRGGFLQALKNND